MDRRFQIEIAVLLLLLVAGCNGGPGDVELVSRADSSGVEIVTNRGADPSPHWSVSSEPVVELSSMGGPEPGPLLDPASVDVDSRGRLIVADGYQVGLHSVLVFDSQGDLLARIGRRGEGPGEFSRLWWAAVFAGDSIAAFDIGAMRLLTFGPSGEYTRQVRIPTVPREGRVEGTQIQGPNASAVLDDGSIVASTIGVLDIGDVPRGGGPAWYRHSLLRVAPEGATWDTLGTFQSDEYYWDGTTQLSYWFGAMSSRAIRGDTLYIAPGREFEILVYHDGSLQRVIRREVPLRPVTQELQDLYSDWLLDFVGRTAADRNEAVEFTRRRLAEGRFAPSIPAIASLITDDLGNLWVEEYQWQPGMAGPTPIAARWSVFDTTGAWIGQVVTPPGLLVKRITEDRILGIHEDALGVKSVRVYAFQKDAATPDDD